MNERSATRVPWAEGPVPEGETDQAPVLVTGAAGFIGSHLCDRLLAEGRRVVGVDDLSTGRIANLAEARSYGKQFTFYNVDIRAEGLGKIFERHRPEVVMHLAAQAGVRPSLEDPIKDANINVMGTLNLLECAALAGARKIVFASSGGTIYGEPRRLPVREAAIGGSHPQSPYGISKKVTEDYLRFYERYRSLDFTALALANVYGPRQDPYGEAGVIAIFAGKMLAGETPTIFGDGNQTRDYVFVDDTVHAFALAMDRGSGRLINIGTGLETSVNGLYRLLGEITGFVGEPTYGPLPQGELRRISLDPSLAEQELGWRPWTHLEDGLRETIAYLKGV
ncbi:MAG TPA: SDR family NAD(P)-dependent oxidoreductase [Actinomycetota bacterium]|nr:SDR family NAD(P)-dependent oxidoreductase [Actinomycetota bacterium]